MIELLPTRRQPGPFVDVDYFVGEPRRSKYAGKEFKPTGSVSDFFLQFACRTDYRVFTRMKFSRRDFVDEPSCRVAELSNQDDRTIVFQRHHCSRSGMAHDFQVDREAVGQRDSVDIQVHDDACVNVLGHEECMANGV